MVNADLFLFIAIHIFPIPNNYIHAFPWFRMVKSVLLDIEKLTHSLGGASP